MVERLISTTVAHRAVLLGNRSGVQVQAGTGASLRLPHRSTGSSPVREAHAWFIKAFGSKLAWLKAARSFIFTDHNSMRQCALPWVSVKAIEVPLAMASIVLMWRRER